MTRRRVARVLVALVAGALSLPGGRAAAQAAAPTVWRIDPDATRVHWEFAHFGTSTVRGRFDRLEAVIEFEPAAGRGTVSITVDAASVSTGLPFFDRVIRGPDVLDVARHPQAWFVARRLDFDAGGLPARLDGELTLRGISRPLVLSALHTGCAGPPLRARRTCGGDYEAVLRRSDFGITHALPFAADTVRLQVQVEAVAD